VLKEGRKEEGHVHRSNRVLGMALYIKSFYTNQELGLRFAAFWSSNAFAGCLSGPLALGLLSLNGKHGVKGWQWLFAIGEKLQARLNI